MALGDAYATVAEYRDAMEKTSSSDDVTIGSQLTAVSRLIDQQLGRPLGFNQDASEVARIYDSPSSGPPMPGWAEAENPWKAGGVSRTLNIDDYVSISSIDIDEFRTGVFSLSLTTDDYELLPRNAPSRPEPAPYRTIELTYWGTRLAWMPGARVRVTGIGGWPAVPAAIKSATIQLTGILRLESPRATNRVNELNQVLSTSRVAQDILSNLMRQYLGPQAVI